MPKKGRRTSCLLLLLWCLLGVVIWATLLLHSTVLRQQLPTLPAAVKVVFAKQKEGARSSSSYDVDYSDFDEEESISSSSDSSLSSSSSASRTSDQAEEAFQSQFDSASLWYPALPTTDTASSTATATAKRTLIGFIRIRKTGSTSFLKFLLNSTSSGLHSWDHFLHYNRYSLQRARRQWDKKNAALKAPFCVFGHPAALEQEPSRHPRRFQKHNRCPHSTHANLQHYWRDSLPYTTTMKQQQQQQEEGEGGDFWKWQSVTMIREPLDRLRSQFYYVQQRCETTQLWRHMFTKSQYQRLCADDFAGWLKLLHFQQQQGAGGGGLVHEQAVYQYRHLSDESYKTAIQMIQGEEPQVVVLLNECFEESLRYMEWKFQLRPGAADAHMESKYYHVNTNTAPNSTTSEEEKEMERLRENAKRWFRQDYEFYHAAVAQFRRQMAAMDLASPSVRNPCRLLQRQQQE